MRLNTSEFLQWLRLYRHDLMNDLQIIQGYATMGKYDKSNEKINQLTERLKDERLLQALNADQFAYWLLTLSLAEKQLEVTYDIDVEQSNLSSVDQQMKTDSENIIERLFKHINEYEIKPIHIVVSGHNSILLSFEIALKKDQHEIFMNDLTFNGKLQDKTSENESLKLMIEYIN